MVFKDKNKQCVICWGNIDFKKDKYVKIIDYEGKKEIDHCYHHLECWKNKFNITQQKIQEQANEWLNKISDTLGGKKVIEI